MDENNQSGLTEQMLEGIDFIDDEIELTPGVNVQGFEKQENNEQNIEPTDPDEDEIEQNIEPTDPDEDEIEQNIEPTDFDEEQFFQSFETIDAGEEEIDQNIIPTDPEEEVNREDPGRQLTELEQQLLDGMDHMEDEIHLTQDLYPGFTRQEDEIDLPEEEDERQIIWSIADMGRAMRDALENGRLDENAETDPNLEAQMDSLEQLIEKYENGQSTSEDKGEILNSFRSINSALENDEEQQIMYIRLSELAGRAETKMFPEEQEELDEDEEELSDEGFGEIEPDPQNEVELPKGDPELTERLNALEQMVREYDPKNREKIQKAQAELRNEFANFTPAMTKQFANIIKDYRQVSAEKKPMEAAAGSDIQPGKPENKEAEPEHAEMTLESFNEEFELLMHSFEFESFGDFMQIPTDGSELNEEQKKMQLKLANAMQKARTALRVGPEDTDPESMLKWCKRVGLLSGRVSGKVDLYRRAGQGNSEEFLTPGDELRMQVADNWISLYRNFPEQRSYLFEYNGVSKIENPNEIYSPTIRIRLTTALDELDESYANARFAREFDKNGWSREKETPEVEGPLVSLEENAAKSFKFVVKDDYLKKLNTGELTKQLKDLQKELKATDPFWVWTNTERFTKLKDQLSSTLESLERFDKTKFASELLKMQAKDRLMSRVSLLAKTAQEYSGVKAGDYASSNKSRDLRRGQAAAKILAFTSAYVVNERVEAMGKAFMECKEACEAKNANQALQDSLSQYAANDMYAAVMTAMEFPRIPGCQDKLALAYTNIARLPIGTQFGQHLNQRIEQANMGSISGDSAYEHTEEEKQNIEKVHGELNTLKSRAAQIQRRLAAKAKNAQDPANKPAPDKNKDLKGMGKN